MCEGGRELCTCVCVTAYTHTPPQTITTTHHLAYLARDTLILQPPENLLVARPCISAVKPNPFMKEKDTSMPSHEKGEGGGGVAIGIRHLTRGRGWSGGRGNNPYSKYPPSSWFCSISTNSLKLCIDLHISLHDGQFKLRPQPCPPASGALCWHQNMPPTPSLLQVMPTSSCPHSAPPLWLTYHWPPPLQP